MPPICRGGCPGRPVRGGRRAWPAHAHVDAAGERHDQPAPGGQCRQQPRGLGQRRRRRLRRYHGHGGATWRAGLVPGAETLEFRDVEGVSARIAYLRSAGPGAASRIYRTVDGGATWSPQFENRDPNAFSDCFAFWTPRRGLTMSDSVSGRFPVIRNRDGETWHDIGDSLPPAQPGEAAFASSGTCVATQVERRAWVATGGAPRARILATAGAHFADRLQ